MSKTIQSYLWSLMRISLGWILLWAFLDKVFGLGFATLPEDAWLNGGSPTDGFLSFATAGPFSAYYQSLAGSVIVDWLFMLGLLGIGTALILGIGLQIAGYAGALLMLLMWSAHLPPEHNPLIDEHVIYALVFILIAITKPGDIWGLGKWWQQTRFVKRFPSLE